MLSRIVVALAGSIFAVTLTFAQDAPSRLDAVQKSGKLRVCTPGDYTPFALAKDGSYEGLDVDLVRTAAKALGAEAVFVKSGWPTLMKDFVEQCDVAVGGISVTLERYGRRQGRLIFQLLMVPDQHSCVSRLWCPCLGFGSAPANELPAVPRVCATTRS